MIVLAKKNHTIVVDSRAKAQKLVDKGYQVIKNKLGGAKIVKSKSKKK
tara:strand:+ start:4754 stop:4897 length:144 start_codon:yes stop_codon:yes gene_type:complete